MKKIKKLQTGGKTTAKKERPDFSKMKITGFLPKEEEDRYYKSKSESSASKKKAPYKTKTFKSGGKTKKCC